MRTALLVILASASTAALAGCAPSRSLPPAGLVDRAWTGRELPPTSQSWQVVRFAEARVGMRYCWGGTGPACFDCSGFVQRAWGSVGIWVPRTTDAIAAQLPEVPLSEVRAGDILWWPGHVGIYAGGGWVVDALDHRHGVVRRAARDPYRAFRPIDAGAYHPAYSYAGHDR
jgi:cell wall-associated NlpC family hydrolase